MTLWTGRLEAIYVTLRNVVAAADEMRRLGDAYEDSIEKPIKVLSEAICMLCSFWEECASTANAKCSQGETTICCSSSSMVLMMPI
jgi:hypothetical protein